MLSKEGFCKALQMIKEQESIDEQFSKALNLVGDGHFVFGAENKYLLALRDVLKEAVNDHNTTTSIGGCMKQPTTIRYGKQIAP